MECELYFDKAVYKMLRGGKKRIKLPEREKPQPHAIVPALQFSCGTGFALLLPPQCCASLAAVPF